MAAEVKRSPSMSFRKSLDSARFRRRHADSVDASSEQQAPPVPTITRAATDHHDNAPKTPSRRKSVRDLWRDNVTRRVSRTKEEPESPPKPPKSALKLDTSTTKRTSRAVNFTALLDRKGNATEASSNNNSASGSDAFRPLGANPPPSRMATLAEEPQVRPLREADMRKLFFGASQYAASGPRANPRIQVTYRDRDPDSTQDGRDFHDFSHSSFELATLQSIDGDDFLGHTSKSIADVMEVPTMLSINGLEPGTVGLDHFLQLGLDAPRKSVNEERQAAQRTLFTTEPEKLGLRSLQVERYIDRLAELGDELASRDDEEATISTAANEQKASEMYSDLFAKYLIPPKYSMESDHDPTGLDVQIKALIKTLSLPDIWYDFSDSDERLVLGKRLFVQQDQPADGDAVVDRNVLLFQITLASELLHRLDLTATPSPGHATSGDGPRYTYPAKVAWDIVLAKRFLQNVRISAAKAESSQENRANNRSSIFSMMSFVTAVETFEDTDAEVQPVLLPRHERPQLKGVLDFARSLGWQHAADIDARLSRRSEQDNDDTKRAYTNPVATPAFTRENDDSYFRVLERSGHGNSGYQLAPLDDVDEVEPNTRGWLSRSWLTGLVLPGASTPNLLMASLLENTVEARKKLGDTVNLSGGFYYNGGYFWSKASVAGRVLAGAASTQDCMGWVHVPVADAGMSDGCVTAQSRPVPSTTKPRIKTPNLIEEESSPYPVDDIGQIQEGDFSWPNDEAPSSDIEITSFKLAFDNVEDADNDDKKSTSANSTIKAASSRAPGTAILSFTLSQSEKHDIPSHLDVRLEHSVYFVSSQPCFPKMRTPAPSSTPVKSPTSPGKNKELPPRPCHPLYKDYTFSTVPVSAVVTGEPPLTEFDHSGLSDEDETEPVRGRQDSGAGRDGRSPAIKQEGSFKPGPEIKREEEETNLETVPTREEARVAQQAIPIKREDARVKLEDIPVKSEDARVKQEERQVKQEDVDSRAGLGMTASTGKRVLILDCRGGQHLQLFARAWCAKVGLHALVGRVERTCVACCVREARALGMRVVIRV